MSIKIPPKPKTTKGQIEALWTIVTNDIPHRFRWLDIKLNFILVFMAVVLAFLGILVVNSF